MTKPYTLHLGDCVEVMKTLPDNSVDAVVTDPPYGISFMGKAWDGADIVARTERRRGFDSHAPDAGPNGGHKSIAAEAGKYDLAPAAMKAFQQFSEEWAREAFRVLKPGGHLLSFSSARTYHRMACGIEDAGFEVRDQAMWLFGTGFPKSLNVSKAIDKAAGAVREVPAPATDAARQWDGWGTALKPAHEPICVARKPLVGTVAANVLAHGTGALNIAGCRVVIDPVSDASQLRTMSRSKRESGDGWGMSTTSGDIPQVVRSDGRWPANLIHDGSDAVMALFPESTSGAMSAGTKRAAQDGPGSVCYGTYGGNATSSAIAASSGSAARFFYCAKASRADRNAGLVDPGPQFERGTTLRDVENAAEDGELKGNIHPTVKPTDLMAYLCRLVTPPGGVVLDPFMGSGSTGKAAMREGFQFVGIEMDAAYMEIAKARIEFELARVTAAREAAAVAAAPAPQMSLFESAV